MGSAAGDHFKITHRNYPNMFCHCRRLAQRKFFQFILIRKPAADRCVHPDPFIHRVFQHQDFFLGQVSPLVRQVQKRGAALSEAGHIVLLFGKAGHREVEGILGRIPGEKHLLTNPDDARAFEPVPGCTYACISQTTMNSDVIAEMTSILREKIPGLVESASVCHATLTRQNAVRELAAACDLVLVAGSAHSSNTLRLCEIARNQGARAELVSGPEAVTPVLLRGAKCVGVTSGASAPDALVRGIFDAVKHIAESAK